MYIKMPPNSAEAFFHINSTNSACFEAAWILPTDDEEEKFADGNTADSEDNAENDASDNNNTDDDQLEGNFRRKLRLSSLPSVTSKDETNDLESSVEFLINGTDDSQEEESEEDVIDEDKEVESVSKKSPAKKFSVGPNNRPRRRRSRRRRRTCIAQFNLSEHSNAKEEEKESSLGAFQEQTFLRRCFSFDMFSRSFSMFDMKKQASSSKNIDCDTQSAKTSRNSLCRSSSSRLSELEDRYKLRYSGSEEKFRSPVKRKISLKEYHIVRREACFHVSMDENEFNSSFWEKVCSKEQLRGVRIHQRSQVAHLQDKNQQHQCPLLKNLLLFDIEFCDNLMWPEFDSQDLWRLRIVEICISHPLN